MTTSKCPECAKEIERGDPLCWHCGHVLDADQLRSIKNTERDFTVKAITFGVLLLGIGWLVYSCNRPLSREEEDARAVAKEEARARTEAEEVRRWADVRNSTWDGSVWQVKRWLEANLRDPRSLEYIEWSPVTRLEEGGHQVRVKYRAKNGFGGFVVSNQLFKLDEKGRVVAFLNYGDPKGWQPTR